MSELIDRQALKDYVSSLSTHPLNEWDTWGVIAAIDKQPTITAVLNKEKTEQKMHERLEKAKTQRETHEEDEPAGSWMVYKAGSKPREFWYFIEWRKGKPIIGQCDGMVFTYEGMAQHVAEKLGEGWKVIDISQEACKKAERLMAAIFAEPPKEEEHGN